jgi:hypothetical protein
MHRLFHWLALTEPSGRRAWAFLSMLLGCGLMTAFAAVGLWMVRSHPQYVFWLAIAAHVQILLALSGFTAMFVKRDVEVTKDGLKLKDKSDAEDSK